MTNFDSRPDTRSESDTRSKPVEIPAAEAFEDWDSARAASEPPVAERPRYRQFQQRPRRALVLFLLTCASTFLVGFQWETLAQLFFHWMRTSENVWASVEWGELFYYGITYSTLLMATLLAHEMGHYLQARRYRVPASLPYFIPFPIGPFGTMGAVIVQGAGVADRRQLFDIAVTGPLAGLVLALPIAWYGVSISEVKEIPADFGGMIFGDPLLLKWMVQAVHGPLPEGHDVILNPVLHAGWFGLFITALNLVPIGQLDGGHILYSLIGRRAHGVAIALLIVAIAYMAYTGYYAFALIVGLLILMGPKHPPTADDRVPLGAMRHVVGWLSLSFLIVGFTPTPISIPEPERPEASVAGPEADAAPARNRPPNDG